MNISKQELEKIVRQVMGGMQTPGAPVLPMAGDKNFLGVYDRMEDAIDAAFLAQKELYHVSVEKREEIIKAIRQLTIQEAPVMARMGVEETGMGRVEDKIIKHRAVADKTPGTEALKTVALTGDCGLTLTEQAPFGVIGAITPSTNPSETVICNTIGMMAAGNTVVFNPHPGACMVSLYAVDLVNRAAKMAGLPFSIAFSVKKPTLETSDSMMASPKVKMLCCTGGPGVVKAVLSSGKKAIGAGAGNPPVVVDETADIEKAAKDIILGASFDNNLPCIAEKEVLAVQDIYDELIFYMREHGAYQVTAEEVKKLEDLVLTQGNNGKRGLHRDWVGRDAKKYLQAIGIEAGDDIRLIIYEAKFEDLFVQMELMMPILPIVAVQDVDTAIQLAVEAEHGLRHTAHMHSKNVDNLTRFARAVETTIFVKNAPSYAGIGVGGEGHCTFTIAGPTGEGLTSASTFTRSRRCVMSEAFRII